MLIRFRNERGDMCVFLQRAKYLLSNAAAARLQLHFGVAKRKLYKRRILTYFELAESPHCESASFATRGASKPMQWL